MNTWARIVIGDSRRMDELAAETVDLVVTSPPYWHIKDYGVPGQIGFGQSLHEYLQDLYRVWRECFRVLRLGGRLCVNVGDQFARAKVYGRYKVIPLHAEIIAQGEHLGLDFLGSIIWQKKTTMNTSGGAPVMGSYPFPPNGLVEIDYEFILIFKKPGPPKKVSPEIREASRLSKAEWKEYFAGHWRFGGARQAGHEAMFPEELPRRLIRMFSFVGDTVLDPFVGSGTTVKAALDLGRNGVGYEVNESFVPRIREKMRSRPTGPFEAVINLMRQEIPPAPRESLNYTPVIGEARPQPALIKTKWEPCSLHRVKKVLSDATLVLENGQMVTFLGIKIDNKEETVSYLKNYVLGKEIILRWPKQAKVQNDGLAAYVFLKNRIHINAYLIKAHCASPDLSLEHEYKKKYQQLLHERTPSPAGNEQCNDLTK